MFFRKYPYLKLHCIDDILITAYFIDNNNHVDHDVDHDDNDNY